MIKVLKDISIILLGKSLIILRPMQKLVDAPTQANLVKLNGFLDYYRSSLDDPWPARNVSRIESDLRAFDRFLRDYLRADKIQGHFVKAN